MVPEVRSTGPKGDFQRIGHGRRCLGGRKSLKLLSCAKYERV